MKRFFLITIAVLALSCMALRGQEEQRLTRQQRKELKARIDSLRFEQAKQLVAEKDFVLESDEVIFKNGITAYVNSNTNFVSVKGENAVVQVAFNIPMGGPNGIGGITVSGSVSGYKVTTDKGGNETVEFGVNGFGISAKILITLFEGSDRAELDITPNFNARRLTLRGRIVPTEESNVFKGTSL